MRDCNKDKVKKVSDTSEEAGVAYYNIQVHVGIMMLSNLSCSMYDYSSHLSYSVHQVPHGSIGIPVSNFYSN